MPSQLPDSAKSALHKKLEEATDPKTGVPGVVVSVVNKDGNLIYADPVGKLGFESPEPITLDTIFWLASCTKMITGIAIMQQVEHGNLDLDNADQVEKLCPELKTIKVIQKDSEGKVTLVDQTSRITLRMLMAHTAGFGYAFFNPELRDIIFTTSSDLEDLNQPLVAQPGTEWNYGFNTDYAGILLERVTGEKVNNYLQKHVLAPMGIKNINMFPHQSMKDNLVRMHQRSPEGTFVETDHTYAKNLTTDKEALEKLFQSGGGGLFASPVEYCEIIATLLNNGTSPKTGTQILKPETVDEMFTNQIPQFPNFARKGIPDAIPPITNPIPELYPVQPHDKPQGWGLTFFLNIEPTDAGRGPNSASWGGLPNVYWWADRFHGVGGMIAAQFMPFADPQMVRLCEDVERIVYEGLKG